MSSEKNILQFAALNDIFIENKMINLPFEVDGLYNMHFDQRGRIVKRSGYTKYNTDSINDDHKICGLHRFYKQDTSSAYTLAACNTALYTLADAAGHAASSIQTGLTADSETHFADYQDKCYFVNGADNMQKYDGTNVRTAGITVPTAPTLNAKTTGELGDGAYQYKVTYVDEDGYESNGSDALTVNNVTFDAEYNGAVLPTVADPVWTASGGAYATVSSGILTIDTSASYAYTCTFYRAPDVDFNSGFYLKTRIRTGASHERMWIAVYDGTQDEKVQLYIYDTKISLVANTTQDYTIDTTEYHVYEIYVKATTAYVYVDGELVLSGTVKSDSSADYIVFGDGSALESSKCQAYIDYVYYALDLATNPCGASGTIGYTINIPVSSDDKVASRNIYRTATDGAVFYYVGEVADNTTETYSDILADNELGDPLHTDHTAPPDAPDNVYKRLSRLFLSVDHQLYKSQLSYPEYMPTANILPTGNREKIMAMVEQLSVLQVLTENDTYRLLGTDETNFEFARNYCNEGCMATRSAVLADNAVIYLGYDGIYIMTDVIRAVELNPIFSKYITDNINRTYIHLAAAVYYDHKYILSYPKGTSAVPNETVYYDFRTGKYGVYSFGFGCYTRLNRGGDGDDLLMGSPSAGRVYDYSGLDDDGSDIAAYFETPYINFGYPERKKKVYDVYLKVKSTTGTALRLYYTLDARDETYKDFTLTADTTGWYRVRLDGGGYECREIKIRPYMSDSYAWEVHGIGITYQLGEAEYA
jgi:hypothetical protein